MKKIAFIIIITLSLIPCLAWAQLKNQSTPVDLKKEIVKPEENSYLGLGLIDMSRLSMSHSFSVSYMSIGGKGVSQSLYLNTMRYQISDPLSLKLQWGIQNFPYNEFGQDNPLFQSGFIFSGAELKYQPSDRFLMKFQYNALPRSGYYRNSYNYDNPIFWDENE